MTIKPAQIIRSRRRSIALIVSPDATLVVRAPMTTPLRLIENFIQQKSHWILKKMAQVQTRPVFEVKKFIDGEKFLYLGQKYELQMSGKTRGLVFANQFFLKPGVAKPREAFVKWYKAEARKIIAQRLVMFGPLMGLAHKSMKITSAKRRWGSCSPSGNLNFSWRLVLAPLEVIDSVVVHELAHLKHRNHSRKFWNEVKAILPDHKSRSSWLKENDAILNI